jgi:hypothetical protein
MDILADAQLEMGGAFSTRTCGPFRGCGFCAGGAEGGPLSCHLTTEWPLYTTVSGTDQSLGNGNFTAAPGQAPGQSGSSLSEQFCAEGFKWVESVGNVTHQGDAFTTEHGNVSEYLVNSTDIFSTCEACPAGQTSNGGTSTSCHTINAGWVPCSHMACELVETGTAHCDRHQSSNPLLDIVLGNAPATNAADCHDTHDASATGTTRIRVFHHGEEQKGSTHQCMLTGTRNDTASSRKCECECKYNHVTCSADDKGFQYTGCYQDANGVSTGLPTPYVQCQNCGSKTVGPCTNTDGSQYCNAVHNDNANQAGGDRLHIRPDGAIGGCTRNMCHVCGYEGGDYCNGSEEGVQGPCDSGLEPSKFGTHTCKDPATVTPMFKVNGDYYHRSETDSSVPDMSKPLILDGSESTPSWD